MFLVERLIRVALSPGGESQSDEALADQIWAELSQLTIKIGALGPIEDTYHRPFQKYLREFIRLLVIIYREPQQLKAFVDDQMYLIDEDPAYFEFLAQLIKSLMTTQGESLLTKRTIRGMPTVRRSQPVARNACHNLFLGPIATASARSKA
jgi:hypothetical protein